MFKLLVTTLLVLQGVAAAKKDKDDLSLSGLTRAWNFVADLGLARDRGNVRNDDEDSNVVPSLPLVFGAGFPRTGTKSIDAVLRQVGHKVYDTRSVLQHNHTERWIECAIAWRNNDNNDLSLCEQLWSDIENLGYTATLDYPVNMFAIPLAQIRPDSKILISIRENETEWLESWRSVSQTFNCFLMRPLKWFVPDFSRIRDVAYYTHGFYWRRVEEDRDNIIRPLPWYEYATLIPQSDTKEGREEFVALQKQHIKEVTTTLSKDRVLTYSVKQGWEPLVKFFNWDPSLSQQDFPHLSDRKSLETISIVLNAVAIGLPFIILFVVFVLCYVLHSIARLLFRKKNKDKKE